MVWNIKNLKSTELKVIWDEITIKFVNWNEMKWHGIVKLGIGKMKISEIKWN